MAGLYEEAFVESLRLGALGVAHEWGLGESAQVTLLNLSENATFLAEEPGRRIVLRVYRPRYHSREEIGSELVWIDALRQGAVVATPKPLACASGGHIATFTQGTDLRHVVAFDFVEGIEPVPHAGLEPEFARLGAISARLHRHARSWSRNGGFRRKTWRFETMLGTRPLWGNWRNGPGLDENGVEVLEQVAARLERRLAAYGESEDRFGLVHADLRLANLLIDEDLTHVIDFDDCGFSWFVYDFAASVSFFEDEPYVAALARAWVEGYRCEEPLGEEHVAMIPTFVMLRRMLLTAWIASHSETTTARELAPTYARGTVRLGQDYLVAEPG